MTMLKFLTAASTLLFAVGCTDQAMKEKYLNVDDKFALSGNAGEMLPLEPVLITEQNLGDTRSKTRTHMMAIGNWLVSCNYTNRGGPKMANCAIVPWNGQMVSELAVPVTSGPEIGLATRKDPSANIRGPGKFADQLWSFECGSLKFQSEDGRKIIPLKTGREAAPLIQRLKSSDCELGYTGKRGEAETIAFTKHGFSEAHQYAKRYVASPK